MSHKSPLLSKVKRCARFKIEQGQVEPSQGQSLTAAAVAVTVNDPQGLADTVTPGIRVLYFIGEGLFE